MNGKMRVQPKTAAKNESKNARAKVIMLKDKALNREVPAQSKAVEKEQRSRRVKTMIAEEEANREKLGQSKRKYRERIHTLEVGRQTDRRTTELLAAKDLLLKATEASAVVEKRLVQTESQRDALEAERGTLREALQTSHQKHAEQDKTVSELQAMLDALKAERCSLHETLQAVQDVHDSQGKVAATVQAQRDSLASERRTLHETLQALRSEYLQQGKLSAQLQGQRDALVLERRTLHETLQTLRAEHLEKDKVMFGLQLQRDTLEEERRSLQQALQVLRDQHGQRQPAAPSLILPPDLQPIPLPVGRNSMTDEEKTLFDQKLSRAMEVGGIQALETFVERQVAGRTLLLGAFCHLRAAILSLANGHVAAAGRMADLALKKDAGTGTVREAAHIHHDVALLEKARALADRLESMQQTIGASDRRFIDEVRDQAQLIDWAMQPTAARRLPVIKGRALNVLAFSLPYSSVGYATRSHGLAIGIRHAGWDIRPYTRPCFPYDAKPELEGKTLPEQDDVDGISYRRLFDFDRKGMNEAKYLHAAISSLTRAIEQEQPEVVHAASNYATALPALIAARRLGVPFVYEMRGFWEVTRSSRDEAFENTPKYRFMQLFDNLVAQQADHVITITTAMKEELLARGVPENKISIAFNSVDPARFVPQEPNHALAAKLGIPAGVPVIGYVGSFVDYEGLDDLMTAAAGLKQAGRDFRLLMVGDGAAFEALRAQVQSLSLEDKVILTGRVPHEEVEDYYSLIDIAPFPRKPWKVCELVSPLKPFEAMALEKVVVVSGTRALKEIVDHERTGFVFEKGNVDSLGHVLDLLIRDPGMRKNVGKTARQWVSEERSWEKAGRVVANAYQRVLTST